MTSASGLRERLGTVLFEKVAGPDGERSRALIHGRPGPRPHPAGSPITRVHGDASMFLGGLRAVLLQTMHPVAMQAVADHSAYRTDMWGRLARTSTFLAQTTFGHVEDGDTAIATVRRIHERIRGTMPDGTAYVASDPHLLGWVHAAEIDSFLLAHQIYGQRRLSPAEADQYVAQAAAVARDLGVLAPPTTQGELRRTLAAYRPELRGTPAAREAVRRMLLHPPLPVAARAPYALLAGAAVALMPTWTRAPLRLPWLPIVEPTLIRGLGHLATGTIRWAMAAPPVPDSSPTAPEEGPA